MMAEQNERRALKELEELRRKVKEVGLELTINKKWVEELFKDNEELKAREKERVEI